MIKIYDSSNLALISSFQAHTSSIYRIRQSIFNDHYVATVSADFTAKIWNISNTNWTLVRTYSKHTNIVVGLEYINEDTIATGSWDCTIQIWSISSGITNITINTGSGVRCLKLLSNSIYLATGLITTPFNINIYNINTGILVFSLSGHTNQVNDLVLVNKTTLISSSFDNTIRIWNLATNTQTFSLTGHTSYVVGLKLISTTLVASCSGDTMIKLWNITSGTLIRTLSGHTGYLWWSVDLLSDGQTVVSSSGDQTLKLWNYQTGVCLNTINVGLVIDSLAVINSTTSLSFLFTT